MADSTRLLDLLLHWQQLREQGQAITPEELCRDHPELLDEVKKQAEALSSLAAFMNPSAAAGENASDDSSSQAETLDQPDQVTADFPMSGSSAPAVGIPGYEILGELGRGGMGVVYKARQLGLNRIVALKMILVGAHAGAQEVARFRTEAQAVARLKHPNIVQIHEIGEHAGLPYFSLEYCEGGSLATKLAGTPLPPLEAAKLVETLARAIAAAHQKNIIHRDLKPHNVLLAEDGTPKITDFGLAKMLEANEDVASPGLTRSGAIMGTPSYMAPEQVQGKTKTVGYAADIYALGVILYEFLTGVTPFRAGTPLEIMLLVLDTIPVAPSKIRNGIPRDLETICLKCLEKKPVTRYGTALELANDLESVLGGRPISARRQNWREQIARNSEKLVGAAMIILLVWFLTPWLEGRASSLDVYYPVIAGIVTLIVAIVAISMKARFLPTCIGTVLALPLAFLFISILSLVGAEHKWWLAVPVIILILGAIFGARISKNYPTSVD